MRKRERWQGLAWLSWMEGDSDAGAVQVPTLNMQNVSQAVHTLTYEYRRYISMERDGDAYVVRVLPVSRNGSTAVLDVGLLYKGVSLRNILATAVVELDLIAGRQTVYRVGSEERVRWVS